MRSIRLHLTIENRSSAAVYSTLADLGRDLDCLPRARHFVVSGTAADPAARGWESNFRCGVLRWFQDDPVPLVPQMRDIALFEGSWSCVDDGGDTAVTFAARLDAGIPHPTVEAAAVRAFIDDAVVILACLFDGNVRVDDVVIQAHEPMALSLA